jgi:Uma2 family endonuclease
MSALPHDGEPERADGWPVPEALKQHILRLVADALEHPRHLRMTYEEFLDWADEDTLAEWVDGEVIMTSPANDEHQNIAGFLDSVLRLFVERNQLGVIRIAPFQMKLAKSGREPDVIFVANAHRARLKKTYLDGPADVVVEIISPESAGRDRGDKYFEYEQAGIPEYWLIDPLSRRAEFYQLGPAGTYQLATLTPDGIYRSPAIPGFWLRVDWLWSLPSVEEANWEIGGHKYAQSVIDRLRRDGLLP